MLNRRALSDVVETPGRRREETRAVEMVRVGQALKLEAIVRGLAPTSMATVGPLKPRPWEPRCIYPDFPHEIICGDIWSDSKLILATESGTFLLEGKHLLLFFPIISIRMYTLSYSLKILVTIKCKSTYTHSIYMFIRK